MWAVNSYARSIGIGAAVGVDADSSRFAVVTIFSDEPVDLPGSLVRRQTLAGATPDEGPTAYRYTGARLLAVGGDQWFLITNPAQGGYRSSVTILRDTEAIRVEVAVPNIDAMSG